MKVTVIGLGYVGSVAAAGLAAAGHDVVGVDIDRARVKAFTAGRVPIYEPDLGKIVAEGMASRHLLFRHADEFVGSAGDVVLVATGTPPTPTGAADLDQVRAAIAWVKTAQPRGCVIAVKSTVPPGTGRRLKETLLRHNSFQYVSNPEFLREGQAVHDWFHPDRIVIGGSAPAAVEAVRSLYSGIKAPVVVTDTSSAEMIKYAANAFLATRISLINEIAALCDRLGASIDDVVSGIGLDPRIGRHFLRAGVGYGGSCFPKDVRAFDQLALNNAYSFELLRAVITVNNRQRLLPIYALRERFASLSNLDVAVLGASFKPNTDDVRESPALDAVPLLVDEGARVRIYDPVAGEQARTRLPGSVEITGTLVECVRGTQAILLLTEWSEFLEADWEGLANLVAEPRFLFDGRNALDPSKMLTLGYEYCGIGRGNHRLTGALATPRAAVP
ncbi:MAG: UDP-glucose/GDP-mannose dehydrogenase family protein [Chloroflexi bacterium]|nr:UDP-glucose/GDP-mannose dehydrogenase family protein [Chloroflexota bacterium]